VATVEELREHTKEFIAGYKCPPQYRLRARLSLSAAGKVLKRELRRRYTGAGSSPQQQ
jgi:acyl-CoA synthetase (AMP-forming)/AMP-acid ligase II